MPINTEIEQSEKDGMYNQSQCASGKFMGLVIGQRAHGRSNVI
jgi:hypothetical protein